MPHYRSKASRSRAVCATVFFGCLACTAVDAKPRDADPAVEGGGVTRLPLLQGGVWQQFRIPDVWIQEHVGEIAPRRVVLTLRPPHPDDYADFTPCSPPSRLVVGIVNAEMALHEHLLFCLYACDESVKPVLWGYRSHLVGVSIDLHEGGDLDIAAHYRRYSNKPDPIDGPASFTSATIGEERVRRHRLTPVDVRTAIQRNGMVSTCGELLDLE